MPDVIVVSAVVACKLSGPFDLAQAPVRVPGMAVDRSLDAGVQKRQEPRCTVLAFPRGEILVTGPQLPHTLAGVGEATAFLLDEGLTVESSSVENIVCETTIAPSIDLAAAADAFGAEGCDPALPEPRLEVVFPETGVKAALFATGKVVLTGARDEETINGAIVHILETLGLDAE
jgi:TATA-box binding protein (TBP) (component of TFIID and TFIIIB)